MLAFLLSLVLQERVTVEPAVVHLANDQVPLRAWPAFEKDPAAGHTTLHVRYRVPDPGIAAGGGIQVGLGYATWHRGDNPLVLANQGFLLGPSGSMARFPLGAPQVERPKSADFASASSTSQQPVEVRIVSRGLRSESLIQVTAPAGLPGNDLVEVVLGDTDSGGPGATLSWHPGSPEVVVFEDFTGAGEFRLTEAALPTLLFTYQLTEAFQVTAPMTPVAGVPFRISVMAMQTRDDYTHSSLGLVEDFTGTLRWRSVSAGEEQAGLITVTEADRGIVQFTATLDSPGLAHFEVVLLDDDDQPQEHMRSLSNVLDVRREGPRLYAGDLQRHSAQGGHASIPDGMCWEQLYRRGDDFGGVVHHAYGRLAGFRHANDVVKQVQARFDPEESHFIAFPAYEWSLRGLHRHVVLRGTTQERAFAGQPYRGVEEPPPHEMTTVAELLEGAAQRPEPPLLVPHHTLWNKGSFPDGVFDWGPDRDHTAQRCLEVYSAHGSSERRVTQPAPWDYVMRFEEELQRPDEERSSLQDALALGYRFGVIGGSDKHSYWPTLRQSDKIYGRSGLTVVVADDDGGLRDRVYRALHQRHTYATTGSRTLLSFTAGDVRMGGVVNSAEAPALTVRAVASGIALRQHPGIQSLRIQRDGTETVWHQTFPEPSRELEVTWTDAEATTPGHSYYVVVVQTDHHVAWSSPIWWDTVE